MSRKIIFAVAAVAALGVSALASTDASARAGLGGGSVGSVHTNFSRVSSHPGNFSIRRNIGPGRINVLPPGRKIIVDRIPRHPRLPPPIFRPRPPHFVWWNWCRLHHHHHHRCHGLYYPPIGLYSEPVVATNYVAPAAVCTNDCDYFLNDAPGCYMAKRKFSTPQGDELRCVKICDEAPVELK